MFSHETHGQARIGWLRAAVLGANDGILSTASLMMGMAAATAGQQTILLTGLAGMVAGAMSMAAGEYVSVSSQADSEAADLALEKHELETDGDAEHRELTELYISRGVARGLARRVAEQLMAHDALGTHAREELGIMELTRARPLQAAMASALAFSVGALMPLLVVYLSPPTLLMPLLGVMTLIFLASLGTLAAWAGRASLWRGALRVSFWGILAMVLTTLVGSVFGLEQLP